MTREEAIKYFERHLDLYCVDGISREAEEMAIQALSQEPYICDTCKHKGDGWDTEPCDGCCGNHSGYEPCEDDTVSRGVFEQVMWERDVAINQLKELGYGLGQKVEPCDDAISRDWLKTAIHNFYYGLNHTPSEEDIQAYIDAAPSVTPKSAKDYLDMADRKAKKIKDALTDNPQKSGKWDNSCTCSVCGRWRILESEKNGGKYNYCPNCGAKMGSGG